MPAATPPARPSRTKSRAGATASSPYAARPWLAGYPEGVPEDFDFPKVPVTRLLDDAAASFPTGVALAFLGTRMTYRELREQVDAFASALHGLGVKKGDRVALVLPNCPQNVIAFFATLRLGAVVVQHNPLYTEPELRHQLADCGATVVVCLDRVYGTVAKVLGATSVRHVVVTSLADYLPTPKRLQLLLPLKGARRARAELTAPVPKGARVRQFTAMVKGAGMPARQVPLDAETDLALLQYTGGTTGTARGAKLTHYNLVSNTYMNRLWDTGATAGKEVTLGVLPLFHVYGLTVAMLNTVLLSGTLVLLPRFDLDRVLDAVDEYRPTLFPGVPPIFKALADSPKVREHDLRSLRLCLSGAMRLPVEVQKQFEKITGARLVEGYGTTETSPSTHCGPTTGEGRPGSIGLPLPGTRAKLVDRDDPSREVAVGEPGELAVAGPAGLRRLLGRRRARGPRSTDDGYLLTGDIAVMERGRLVHGRRPQEGAHHRGRASTSTRPRSRRCWRRCPACVESVVVGVPGPLPRRDRQGVRGAGGRPHRARRAGALRDRADGVQGPAGGRVRRRPAALGRRQGAAPRAGRGRAGQGRRRAGADPRVDAGRTPPSRGPARRGPADRAGAGTGAAAGTREEGPGEGGLARRRLRRRRLRRRRAATASPAPARKRTARRAHPGRDRRRRDRGRHRRGPEAGGGPAGDEGPGGKGPGGEGPGDGPGERRPRRSPAKKPAATSAKAPAKAPAKKAAAKAPARPRTPPPDGPSDGPPDTAAP